MRTSYRLLWCGLIPALALAQSGNSDLAEVLKRLERLEKQNHELMEEVRSLRQEVAASRQSAPATTAPGTAAPASAQEETTPPAAERLDVVERRTEELAQDKVSASQRLPLSITGMALFNAGWTGRANGGVDRPTTASLGRTPALAGGTLRQSVIGFRYEGPQIAGGGVVRGSLYLDLFGGTGTSLNSLARIRIASLELDWKNTTFMVGQEKPLIAPREPTSLAQMGVSPLTAAGNLWLWQPQVRVEQRFRWSASSGLRTQFSVFQTAERNTTADPEYADTATGSRPGIEGRFEFWKEWGETRRIEIAPGFHSSQSHVAGVSLPSRIFSLDWMIRPLARVDFTGAFFQGENVGVLGSLRQGVVIQQRGSGRTVHSQGGWGQLTWRALPRVTFNVYGGTQDDRNRDLVSGLIGSNQTYAGNVIYRLGPNVLASFEAYQVRTNFFAVGNRAVNHYDLALAYQF